MAKVCVSVKSLRLKSFSTHLMRTSQVCIVSTAPAVDLLPTCCASCVWSQQAVEPRQQYWSCSSDVHSYAAASVAHLDFYSVWAQVWDPTTAQSVRHPQDIPELCARRGGSCARVSAHRSQSRSHHRHIGLAWRASR